MKLNEILFQNKGKELTDDLINNIMNIMTETKNKAITESETKIKEITEAFELSEKKVNELTTTINQNKIDNITSKLVNNDPKKQLYLKKLTDINNDDLKDDKILTSKFEDTIKEHQSIFSNSYNFDKADFNMPNQPTFNGIDNSDDKIKQSRLEDAMQGKNYNIIP